MFRPDAGLPGQDPEEILRELKSTVACNGGMWRRLRARAANGRGRFTPSLGRWRKSRGVARSGPQQSGGRAGRIIRNGPLLFGSRPRCGGQTRVAGYAGRLCGHTSVFEVERTDSIARRPSAVFLFVLSFALEAWRRCWAKNPAA